MLVNAEDIIKDPLNAPLGIDEPEQINNVLGVLKLLCLESKPDKNPYWLKERIQSACEYVGRNEYRVIWLFSYKVLGGIL